MTSTLAPTSGHNDAEAEVFKEALYIIWYGANRLGDSGVHTLGDNSAFVNPEGSAIVNPAG